MIDSRMLRRRAYTCKEGKRNKAGGWHDYSVAIKGLRNGEVTTAVMILFFLRDFCSPKSNDLHYTIELNYFFVFHPHRTITPLQ